jgi:hypothetical protein
LQLVRETTDDGTGSANHAHRSGCARRGRWARQAKHKHSGGILAGEWNFAIDRSGRDDDLSPAVF